MEWLINNWFVVLGIVAVFVVIGVAIYKFAGLPTSQQIYKIKKWMLYAVIKCEKTLGEKTGEVKLRMCWDMFITRFPMVSKVISFDTFKFWVDEALDEMKKLLDENKAVKNVVDNTVVVTGGTICGTTITGDTLNR